jgi:pimeloyl-ACP methyl ester carboxylesterase
VPRAAHEPVLVWLNAGAIDHSGPNRLYTRLARRFAAHGVTSVRLDLPGLGDSPAPDGGDGRLYTRASIPDVARILDSLEAALGVRRFVLAGLCAGAYAAWHAGRRDPRVVGEILINPQTFHFEEGDSLEIGARVTFREAQHYRERIFRVDAWKKLLGGGVDLRYVAKVALRRARDLAGTRVERLLLRFGRGDARTLDLMAGFSDTEARGAIVLLVFSATDPGLDYLRSHLGPDLALLGPHRHTRVQVVDGADHTFTPLWSQEVLADLLEAHVRRELGAR